MYSVVLATMLAAGSTTPAWHHCHSCYGCYGCYSCYNGYGCYGCHGCHIGFFHRSYCNGCWGCSSCYGCTSYVYSSCCSCYVCSSPVIGYGCNGCSGPRVMPVPSSNPEVEALRKEVERLKKALEKVPDPKKKSTDEGVSAPVSSRVTVTLPSDARLWVENLECPLTSSVRSFETPPLNPNQKYYYNLKVEVARDGRKVSETQRVIITPGQEARVDFNSRGLIGTVAR